MSDDDPKQIYTSVLYLDWDSEELGGGSDGRVVGNAPFPTYKLWNNQHVEELIIAQCPHSIPLSPWIGNIHGLKELWLEFCRFTELPSSIGNLQTLEDLCIGDCPNITSLPEEIVQLSNLQTLTLRLNDSLTSIPERINRMPQLQHVSLAIRHGISNAGITRHTEYANLFHSIFSIQSLKSLDILYRNEVEIEIRRCSMPNLEFLEMIFVPNCVLANLATITPNLRSLVVRGSALRSPHLLTNLPSGLKYLSISGVHTHSADERIGWIRTLAERYKQLAYVSIGSGVQLPLFERYLLKFNQCGRVLINESGTEHGNHNGHNSNTEETPPTMIPLSVWPAVLARVHFAVDKPN